MPAHPGEGVVHAGVDFHPREAGIGEAFGDGLLGGGGTNLSASAMCSMVGAVILAALPTKPSSPTP